MIPELFFLKFRIPLPVEGHLSAGRWMAQVKTGSGKGVIGASYAASGLHVVKAFLNPLRPVNHTGDNLQGKSLI